MEERFALDKVRAIVSDAEGDLEPHDNGTLPDSGIHEGDTVRHPSPTALPGQTPATPSLPSGRLTMRYSEDPT